MKIVNFAENILLTGAGFTKNFGGFLAGEMWALIFNHRKVQERSIVRELMLDDFDYESVYEKILWEPTGKLYGDKDKDAIKAALLDAYKKLDSSILSVGTDYKANIYGVNKFIERFSGDIQSKKVHCFFTLNQDRFVEANYSSSGKPLTLPGVQLNLADNLWKKTPLETNSFIKLRDKGEIEKLGNEGLSHKNFNYIKLHGSYGWLSSSGSDAMVIGLNKESQIGREPLLAWYLDIFERALSQATAKLFVIGYGFHDKHINKIVSDSIVNHGLRLYVLSPESPVNFKVKLKNLLDEENREIGERIYDGLTGYFPYTLQEVFPPDQSNMAIYDVIRESYFS